jgi:hypothetical protein
MLETVHSWQLYPGVNTTHEIITAGISGPAGVDDPNLM